MPQVTVRRPLCKLDLCDELGPKPYAVLHLFLSQSPLGSLFLGQVAKRAGVDLQPFEFPRHLAAKLRHKAVSHLGGTEKFPVFVIAHDQRVEWVAWSVAADHQLLPQVDLVLDPCAGSLARLVEGVLALGDDALESKFLGDPDQICWCGFNVF